MLHKNVLAVITQEDMSYTHYLKAPLSSVRTSVLQESAFSTLIEITALCKANQITAVVSTSQKLLSKLEPEAKLSNYAGSVFKYQGLEILFIFPLSHHIKVPYGSFINSRYISKLTSPNNWLDDLRFDYRLVQTQQQAEEALAVCNSQDCIAVAVDIETIKEGLQIRCVGFTAILMTSDSISLYSFVIPLTDTFNLAYVRKILNCAAPKIGQNFKYDLAYLARYNLVPYNYLWDTATMMHCWYSELPKDLAFIQAFFVRLSMYWKDMSKSADLATYYEYCGRDTQATAVAAISWILFAPEWAKQNYLQEFPLLFPAHYCEMIGVKRDTPAMLRVKESLEAKIAKDTESLQKQVGVPGFNPNSPPQVKALLKILGCSDLESTDEANLAKAQFRHPLNDRILDLVLEIRGDRKLVSTYLKPESDFRSRVLFSINPHGTDTGRLASQSHHFWCGYNIQNNPRGKSIKQTICADDGYLLGECDLEQAESRDTAYITGDENLISAVSGGRDFHSVNAAAFFGRKYEEIFDDEKGKTRDKALRDLSKRVNHGANYNMGEAVLVNTMGLKNIYKAARLLGLPKLWGPRDIARYLLAQFDRTYPVIRGAYHAYVKHCIATTRLLVGATGWTRYCFADPTKSKEALNAYVAHSPQSLNAMVLNKAFLKVFHELQMSPKNIAERNFKLITQIHDSIFFQYRIGHEYLCEEVKKRMEIPVDVRDINGKVRTLLVPAAIKTSPNATHWHLIE